MKRLLALVVLGMLQVVALPAVAQDRGPSESSRRPQPTRSVRQAPASRPGQTAVRPASHQEIIHDEYIVDDGFASTGCDSCGGGGCSSCNSCDTGSCGLGGGLCNTCSAPARFCICFPSHGWVHAEYLLWYQDGMRIPSLITTGGVGQDNAGVLGAAGVSTLYGNNDILDEESSGFRIRFGWWLASFPGWGLEGEYVGLGEQRENFNATSDGSQILARPFFNVTTGEQASQLLSFPGQIRGRVDVDTTNKFDGAAFRFRRQMCCSSGCGFSELCCTTVPTSSRLDGTLGYRFWELKESLQVTEALTSLTQPAGSFAITDRFETRNQFNGAELGVLWQGRRGWWSLDGLMRLGIGNVHQTVTISGTTTTTTGSPAVTTNAVPQTGIFAVASNIGTYDRDKFTMVPELGLTLGYQMTKRVRMTAGYSLIYWGNVVRPGDQIDTALNPNQWAPVVSTISPQNRPQFQFVETDYYVQGLSFGGEFRW
ncbi:MAG: BBP7 family outer membrane beta-barrel protein [Pirellulaceae bacterium]